ncbi:MAG TPA: TonB family protein [Pseudomonadales bacterium]
MHPTKRFFQTLAATWFGIAVLSSSVQAADLRMNGVGIHYAVTEEIYIGALFLEAPASTAEQAINMPGAKRMEMRILAESWRPRSFATAWLQLLNINNPPDEVNAMASEVQAFSNVLEDKLEFGDSLSIALNPGKGITMAIDDVAVAHIDNEAFFNLLLRCWLGKRSPSNDFTRDLLHLSKDNADTVDRFDVTLPEPGRREAIAQWASAKALAPAAPKAVVQAAPKPAATPKPVVAAPKPVVAAPKPVAAAPKPVASAPKPAVSTPAPVVAAEPEPETLIEPTVAAEPVVAVEKPTPAAEPVTAAVATTEPTPTAEVDVEALEKTYRAYILRDTYKKVRYPQKAASRNQEGEVVVAVTVKRDGSLVHMDIKEKSYPALNSAAEDAIESAAPFAAAPDELPGDTFTFDIPIRFKIPR